MGDIVEWERGTEVQVNDKYLGKGKNREELTLGVSVLRNCDKQVVLQCISFNSTVITEMDV